MKYLGQILCSFLYTELFSILVFAIVIFPTVFVLSLSWWQMIIAILLLGGIIMAIRVFAYTSLLMPYHWINKNNGVATVISIILLAVNFIRYGYNVWTCDGHGIWVILFCLFVTYELLSFFVSALPILILAYDNKEQKVSKEKKNQNIKKSILKKTVDYDKLFCEYYNEGMASLQQKKQIDNNTVIKFLSSIGDRRKDYVSYANSRYIAERPYLPYMIFMRLPLTMEDKKDGQLYFTIKAIDVVDWKYVVEFDKDVSLIYKDNDSDNEWPKKKHTLSTTQLEEIHLGKLVGTFLHYHC